MQKVWSMNRTSKRSMEEGRKRYPPASDYERPKTAHECDGIVNENGVGMGTPGYGCPFLTCVHNLAVDVNERTGSYSLNVPFVFDDPDDPIPSVQIDDRKYTCERKAANAGPQKLENIGDMVGITRERVRQIVERAFDRISQGKDSKKRLVVLQDLVGLEGREKKPRPTPGETWMRVPNGPVGALTERQVKSRRVLVEKIDGHRSMVTFRFEHGGVCHRQSDRLHRFLDRFVPCPIPFKKAESEALLKMTPSREIVRKTHVKKGAKAA